MRRARLSLEGLSLGDSFGERFFVPPALAESLVERRVLPAPPWHYTDDTVMALSIVETLEVHGAIDQETLAQGFSRRYRADPGRGYGGMAHHILREIGAGAPWRRVSRAAFGGMGSMGNGGAMRAAPIGGYFAVPFLSAYHASKFALEGLSESMRHELLPFGVFVCLIEPGTFRTPIFDTNRRNASGSDDPSSPFRATMARAESRQQRLLRLAPTDTRRVSRAIHSALTERSPRLRRFVGIDARLQRLAKRLLPFRVLEVGISLLTR